MIVKTVLILVILVSAPALFSVPAHSQIADDAPLMFKSANDYFVKGEYKDAIKIYDDILDMLPKNIPTLKMKGIALSNLGDHDDSLKQFFKVLQSKPDDALALTGMGVGFGNLGEYQEAKYYFEKSLQLQPQNIVIINYYEFVDKVIEKYPYTPTEKPTITQKNIVTSIPSWIKNNAMWWSEGTIDDSDFIFGIQYLIQNDIIEIAPQQRSSSSNSIPAWVKHTAGWWASDQISDEEFLDSIHYMIINGLMMIDFKEELEQQKELEFKTFEKYLFQISKNIANEKRYIEYPNPSGDVIKKFLRDYVKWNFEQEAEDASRKFPNPTYYNVDGEYLISYKVFVNDQPPGLPLDHVSTLNNSLEFWETQELNVEGKKTRVELSYTENKLDANVWVTWIVRDLGEGVLGHAHFGKGIVEVTLGDFDCDGSFQLYDVNTVETIMTHELGHSIGLKHVSDPDNIMFSNLDPKYAYCLLN